MRESDFFCNFARFLHVEIRMKKIFVMIAVCCAMIACTEQNIPVDPGTEPVDTTSVTPTDTTTVTPTDTTITTADTIRISWSGQGATIEGSHTGVTVTDDKGYVTVNSTVKDITYLLSGSGQGQLTIYGTNRHQLILRDLTLTCSDGPAINNQCKKSCFVVLQGASSLTDGSSYASSTEDRKAAFFSEGQMIFSGAGSLAVTGNYKHAIASDDYIQFTESTGTLTITAKVNDGIHANDGIFIDGGVLDIYARDEGIRTDSNTIAITAGTVMVESKSEGIESKGTLTISGGQVYSKSTDDAINSGGDMTISGGYVYAYSTSNDGIDANGNMYITGGLIYAIGATSPEMAMDANTEGGKKLYVQGGTIIAVGNLENGASITGGTAMQTTSWNAETWYALYNGSTLVAAIKTPSSSSSSGGGGRPGGGGGSSQKLVVYTSSTPALKSGVSVSGGTEYFAGQANIGGTVSGGSNVTLSSYSSSGGGGGGRPGGW